jgi:hypothetical protein
MKLNELIENKSRELVENKTFKSVKFRNVDACTMSPNTIGRIYSFCGDEQKIYTETDVQEVTCKELTKEINAIEIIFDVVKPRCRKSNRFSLFVREI